MRYSKALILYDRTILKQLANEIHNELTEYFLKREITPICSVCHGLGYLYQGKSLIKYYVDEAVNYISANIINSFENINMANVYRRFDLLSQNLDYLIKQVELNIKTGNDKELKAQGFTKCPECKGYGTLSVFLENFGNIVSKVFLNDLSKRGLVDKINKRLVNQITTYYKRNPVFKKRKYRKQIGNFSITTNWQSRYISDLTQFVVGDFGNYNSFAGLLKRFARVKTGAMKSGLYKEDKVKYGKIKEVHISTTARAESKKYPNGFLYATLYSDFPNNVNRNTWSRGGLTTSMLFNRALTYTERTFGLEKLHSLNQNSLKFVRLFDFTR